MHFAWPLNETAISYFISWSSFVKKHSPNTTTTYLSIIKLIHDLRRIDSSACNSFISRTLLRGAENLHFYEPKPAQNKKVMTLPLLELIGHEISLENWSIKSKSVKPSTLYVRLSTVSPFRLLFSMLAWASRNRHSLAASLYCSAGGLWVVTVSSPTFRDRFVMSVKLASFLAPARNVYT